MDIAPYNATPASRRIAESANCLLYKQSGFAFISETLPCTVAEEEEEEDEEEEIVY